MKLVYRLFLTLYSLLLLLSGYNCLHAAASPVHHQHAQSCQVFLSNQVQTALHTNAATFSTTPERKQKRQRIIYTEETESEDSELSLPKKEAGISHYFSAFYAPVSALSCSVISNRSTYGEPVSYYTSPFYILFRVIRI